MSTTKLSRATLKYSNDRERELMRVVLGKFEDFEKRSQPYYRLEGISTSHLVLKCIEDHTTLHTFWPPEQQRFDPRHGNIYMLGEDTMTKVQSAIRDQAEKLAKKGYLQKVGNVNERRWLPANDLLREISQEHRHEAI